MKRLVLVAPRSELARLEGLPDLTAIESFQVIHQFRFNPRTIAGICEVKFRSPALSPDRMAGHAGLEKVETLAHLDDGTYVAYFEGRPSAGWAQLASTAGVHLLPPFELTPKNWRIAALGSGRELRRFLTGLRRRKIHYRVQSLGSADFRKSAPLGALTARQREVLVTAHRLGYYDLPRRHGSARIAEVLHVGKSTMAEHLRKAEKRLLDRIISEDGRAVGPPGFPPGV